MKKKIFIIHGFGVKDGIGWEAGGDLDTVTSNVFYTVWAENEIKKEKGSNAVLGVDYDYDFVNYSEGLSHLAAHSGCDVYIPDFPIDALSPRLEILYIPDENAVPLINEFNNRLFALKLWMTRNAQSLGEYFKKIFNSAYKQKTKVLEHPDVPTIKVAIDIISIVRAAAELSIIMKKSGSGELETYLKALAENLTGEKLKNAKNYILELMGGYLKEDQMDALDSEQDILKIEESNEKDFSAKGRINYTDDFIIIAAESVAYAYRNIAESRTLSYDKSNSEKLLATAREVAGSVSAIFKNIESVSTEFLKKESIMTSTVAAGLVEDIRKAAIDAMESIENVKNAGQSSPDLRQKITVLLMEQASGKTVSDIKVTFRKLLGNGYFEDALGNKLTENTATVSTDAAGSAFIYYIKPEASERFQISATYDDVRYLMIPEEIISAAESGYVEDIIEEEDEDSRIDRAMSVSLSLLEKQFRYLAEHDVNIASITDHHPYTPAVMELLNKLKDEGVIKELNIQSSPRGEELPVEKQVCGANIVFSEKISNAPYRNEGLEELNKIARLQDLHIEKVPLAISLSKLIGSKFSKVEMVQKLSRVTDRDSLMNIMTSTGWANVVNDYEIRLSQVLPRVEANVINMRFQKPTTGLKSLISRISRLLGRKDKNKIDILACLSAFCDPRKNEPQINVASAIDHIINRKNKTSDYFFYCYGSQILTKRKMDNDDERINLSILSQYLGTKADGGHSGASTCKPLSNPNFPRQRLSNVKETNFLEYLHYIAQKISEHTGFNVDELKIVDFGYEPAMLKNLEKMDSTLVEIVVKKGWIRKKILIAKMLRADYSNKDANPSYLQQVNYLSSRYKFDYLFMVQGPLTKVILANIHDRYSDIDLVKIAQSLGWNPDTGDRNFAIASARRNKKITKEWRMAKDEQFYEVCGFLSQFIEKGLNAGGGEPRWKIHSILAPKIPAITKEMEQYAGKMKYNIFNAALIPSDKNRKNISVAVVNEPYIEGFKSPSLTVSCGILRKFLHLELYKYLIYIKYSTIYLINIGDENKAIDCATVASCLGGKISNDSPLFCAIEKKEISMPAGFERVTKNNMIPYIKTLMEKMFHPLGYKIEKVEKKTTG